MDRADDRRLVRADEAQKQARDPLTAAAWGEGLSLDAYLRRERRLRALAVPRLGMRTWLLVDASDRILSSCETFALPSVVRTDEGEEWGISSGVASVFTEEPLRRKGHATRMLDLLSETLAGEDAAHAVVLFSDVGAAQYARSGFRARPAFDWRWPAAAAGASSEALLFGEEALGWRWGAQPVPAGRFVVLPTTDTLEWFLERERIYASELDRPRPKACGAALEDSLALFYAQPRDSRLWMHWLSAQSARHARALVTAARAVARDAGLAEVRFWEDAEGFPFPDGLEGGVREARVGGLPMLRALDARVRAEDWCSIPRALWV
ncbi:MAG TPA: N-acetyltransferase [Myxococcaceae bacterium]|nr:N-acetyltransferase [Myxococcaceae bacterium]